MRQRAEHTRPKARRDKYESEEFYARWHSSETLASIAKDLGASTQAVSRAAHRRGWAPKQVAARLGPEMDSEVPEPSTR